MPTDQVNDPPTESLRPLQLKAEATHLPSTHITPVVQTRRSTPSAFVLLVHPPGPSIGRSFWVGPEPLVIGRNWDCAISTNDELVSRRHAQIERRKDGVYLLTDLGSANGTKLNGKAVDQAELKDGDAVQVGKLLLRVILGPTEPATE